MRQKISETTNSSKFTVKEYRRDTWARQFVDRNLHSVVTLFARLRG